MSVLLQRLPESLAPDVHAVFVLDQAGQHGSRQLCVPENVTLVPLPPYAPEPNPVERVWLHRRERFLSYRLLNNNDAIADACCQAWNQITPERLHPSPSSLDQKSHFIGSVV